MKTILYTEPRSAFLSTEKDTGIIANKILKNDRLKNLLYYTSKDCLSKPYLTEEQSLLLFGTNIKIVPKIKIEENLMNYLIINFDGFIPNASNPEFRNNVIEFDILCHLDQWQLKDFELRPYKIAAEIDSMFNDQRLTGLGKLEFLGASQIFLENDYAGLCLTYLAIHGEEDKKKMPNPIDEEPFIENFNKVFNDQ